MRAFTDRRLIVAAVTSVVIFLIGHNVILNFSGFVEHVRFIIGPGSATYRVYEPTLAGHLALLRTSLRLTEVSMGWPLFAIGVAGLVLAIATPGQRRIAIWLLVPAVSYYLGFINVILYNYDRFMMPICFVLAMFGGLAFDRLLGIAPYPHAPAHGSPPERSPTRCSTRHRRRVDD